MSRRVGAVAWAAGGSARGRAIVRPQVPGGTTVIAVSTVPVVEGGLPDVGGGLVVTDARSRAGSWVRGRLWVAFSAVWLVGLAYPFAEAWAAPASTARVASLGESAPKAARIERRTSSA